MRNICIIGAGNIGSRHLQALVKIRQPLSIQIVDPSAASLDLANQRYNQMNSFSKHKLSFLQNTKNLSNKIYLAFIATNSDVRRAVLEKLLQNSSVKYLILEKILFQKKEDYEKMRKLLEKKKTKTWINFSMRTMPFYRDFKGKLEPPIQMIVSGGQYGLITNVIHFIDYITYLTGNSEFRVDTSNLDKQPIESKRKGFLELNGTLSVHFKDGSTGLFTCYPAGNAPFVIELSSKNFRCISKESERKAWISQSKNKWVWQEATSNIPFQSDMTNFLAEEILNNNDCTLTRYSNAALTHIILLDALLKFLNSVSKKKYDYYPFT